VDDPIRLLYLAIWPGMIVLPPVVLLVIGWSHLRARRYPLASVFATITWVWSWVLLTLEVPAVFIVLVMGGRPWEHPLGLALISYPPMMWVFVRMLRASITENREKDLAAWNALVAEERERGAGNSE